MFKIVVFSLIGICAAMPKPSDSLTDTIGVSSGTSSSGDLADTLGRLSGSSGDTPTAIEYLIAALTDGSTSSGLSEKAPALLENVGDLTKGLVKGLQDGASVGRILNTAVSGLPEGADATLDNVGDGLSSDDPVNGIVNAALGEVCSD